MRMDEYEQAARTTAQYPDAGAGSDAALAYVTLGLAGEAGELANKVKKILRGDPRSWELRANLIAELGDVLWYVAAISRELHVLLSQVAEENLAKLAARDADGTIKGSGDHRQASGTVTS